MNVKSIELNEGQAVQFFNFDGKLYGGRVVHVHHGFFEVQPFGELAVYQFTHTSVCATNDADKNLGYVTVMEVE